ncbi:hypothetical protein [Nonomuraea lactucae]|uniref:hypothetical protein n=1 Tax=Nonomuraea lactucae TaxID=2249762 RepID=UPI000DE1A84C|nr:hypothetical protein [Nonomuraea lactucae]
MAFDEARYVREVLDPARQTGGVPPSDLQRRYQLDERMSPAEVTETVRQVRQCWRRSRQMLKYRKIIDQLSAEHAARYEAIFQAAADGDLGPLRAETKAAREQDRQRVAGARRRLDDAAGKLRLLPPDIVSAIAQSAGIDPAEAARLASSAGIEVREPDPLPQSPPYSAYARVREALDLLGHSGLARYLFPDHPSVSVLGPMPGIRDRVAQLEQETRRRAIGVGTERDSTVLTALRHTADPAALVLYDVVARLRERIREHPYDDTLLRHATEDLGLDADDAKRLIFAIRQESGVVGGPAGRLRELVERGEIQAAADFAEALPADALTGEAAELSTEIRARLNTAVGLRDQARTEPDRDRAWIMLEDALRRVPDLPGADELLAGLAPHPPSSVRASSDSDSDTDDVVITWQPSPSRAGEIDYDVFRDGVPLAESAKPGVRDTRPPVNRPVTYAVAARRRKASSQQVAATPVVLRPEPRDLRLSAGDGVVVGQWTAPPQAARVSVTRDGVPVPVQGSGFRDRKVRNRTSHEYVVAAVYRTPGGEVTTPGLRRTVTPQPKAEPVPELSVEVVPGGGDRLLLRCEEPAWGMPEFFALDEAPPWPFGASVPVTEVRAAARPLPAVPSAGGHLVRPDRTSLVLLVVTVVGELATIGAHREHVNLAAPQRVSAQRRGDMVHLGLEWPRDVGEVEVRWGGRRLTVSAAAYRSQGGIRLRIPQDEAVTVEVAATATAAGGAGVERVRGPSVSVRLAAVVPVRYLLRRAGAFHRRRLVVELTSERPAVLDRLVLVCKPGGVQPRSADDGMVVGEWSSVGTPATLELPVPRQRGPYWLRCFAEGAVELVDPPVRVLKVG